MPGPRPYGYRLREDQPQRPLGGQKRPLYDVDAPAAVADAAARAPAYEAPVPTLTRTTDGLLYRDQFTRADGAIGAEWTTPQGVWSVASNQGSIVVTNGTQANGGANVPAETADHVVQARMKITASTLWPSLRAKYGLTADAASAGYVAQFNGSTGRIEMFRQNANGSYTSLATTAVIAGLMTVGATYDCKLSVRAGSQKFWKDTVQQLATADATHDARTGRGGFRFHNAAAAPQTQVIDDYALYRGNNIVVGGLSAGMKVRLTPGATTVATGDTVTINLEGTMCPLQTIEVLDDLDNVQATLTPDDGVWGGDVYNYAAVAAVTGVSATARSSSAVRVQWTPDSEAQGYRIMGHPGDNNWQTLADVPREATSWDHEGLAEASTHHYRVHSLASGVVGAASATVSATTPLAAPTGVTATAAVGSIDLAWTDASSAEASYAIERAIGSGSWADLVTGLAAGTQAYTDVAPDPTEANRYRVAAVAGDGTRSYSSEVSARLAEGGSIVRTVEGLLFRDQFTRADGALGADWTSDDAGWAVAGNAALATVAAAGRARARAATVANRDAMLLQASTAQTGANVRPSLLAKWDPAGGGNGYLARLNLFQGTVSVIRVGLGAEVTLGTIGSLGNPVANGVLKFHVAPGVQQVYMTGKSGTTNDATYDAQLGAAGIGAKDLGAGGGSCGLDDVAVCRNNAIRVEGLPAGYKVKVGTRVAVEVGGVATIDCAEDTFPYVHLSLLDAGDVLKARVYPDGGVWGGDEYEVQSIDPLPPPPIDTIPVGIGPAGTYGGVAVGFSVYHTATMTNGVRGFTSKGDTTASEQMLVTFDQAVRYVKLTCQDPTWAGNVMEALDALGNVLDAVAFDYNSTPGTNAPSTKELQVDGIRTLRLTPAAADFVSYSGLTIAL